LIPTRFEVDPPGKEAVLFLKKRNKNFSVPADVPGTMGRTQETKSFLVLFSKKNAFLPW
jgi:hypothetical protein